jgi:DNA-directed RNA polymerase specialized sigma24 family protein
MRLIGRSRTETSAPAAPSAPASAFDALHEHCAGAVVRQVELLTGNPRLARRAVRTAFDLAWQCWPDVAVDPDPVGWIRTAAYDHALAPWQRWIPGRRSRRRATAGPERALRTALLRLPPASRRTVLLYDGLGLDLPETAAETAASTPAAATRIMRARAALGEGAAAWLPALLAEAGTAGKAGKAGPSGTAVRRRSERRVRCQTVGAVALTLAVAVTTGTALTVAPVHGMHPPRQATTSRQEQRGQREQDAYADETETTADTRDRELRRDEWRCEPYDDYCAQVEPREPFH